MLNNQRQRMIILDLAITLDGYIEGKNGEVDWCIMDDDMNFTGFLNEIDTILYGRKSYDLWGQYIPQYEASAIEKEIWKLVHSKDKYVFTKSKTYNRDEVILIKDNIAEEVNKLKTKPGKDIWLYGGASLITSFINLNLVDEFRLSIHPVILGAGKPLFVNLNERMDLKMVKNKTFSSGVVQLIYHRNGF